MEQSRRPRCSDSESRARYRRRDKVRRRRRRRQHRARSSRPLVGSILPVFPFKVPPYRNRSFTHVLSVEGDACIMTDGYTADEIARHNHEEDLWIVIHGEVYNVTSFLKEHPGGEEVLLALAGQDGTECFDSIGHSQEALLLREKYKIGKLVSGPSANRSNNERKTNTEVKEPTADYDWKHQELSEEKPWLPIYGAAAVVIYAIIFYYFWF